MSERIKQTPVVETIRAHFLNVVEVTKKEHPRAAIYTTHVQEVERWALEILKDYPQADSETVLLGVWMHDIGNMIGNENIDHALRSTTEVLELLPELGLTSDKVNAVAHCVRTHRNKDLPPATLEARILAAADSASHMTSSIYTDFATRGDKEGSIAKLKRDFRDVNLIPGLQRKLAPVHNAWMTILEFFPD